MSLRSRLRNATLDALSLGYTLSGRNAAIRTPRVQFVYTHDLGEGEAQRLRTLLTELAEQHAFVPYGEGAELARAGGSHRPTMSFSMDDGFASCLRAAEVFEEFDARACFFVCTDIVGESDGEKARRFCNDRLRTQHRPFMSWRELETLVAAGHEIGCHTRSHPNLATLSRGALEDEVGGAKAVLERRFGSTRHFAWPFGRFSHVSREALEVVRSSGFTSCASAERGAHWAATTLGDLVLIRRDNVELAWPRRHVRYFLARNAVRGRDKPFPDHLLESR